MALGLWVGKKCFSVLRVIEQNEYKKKRTTEYGKDSGQL
jgi:hypothetical protein